MWKITMVAHSKTVLKLQDRELLRDVLTDFGIERTQILFEQQETEPEPDNIVPIASIV